MSRGVRARIHLSALRHNLRRAKQSAPRSRVMAVVKADGYGHGLIEVARSLVQELSDTDAFAVEDAGEGVKLRQAGIEQDIVLLSGFHDTEDLDSIVSWRLSAVIHDHWQVAALSDRRLTGALKIWVKLDSGMHRVGFAPGDVQSVLDALNGLRQVRVQGVMSHLANADDPSDAMTDRQCRTFRKALGDSPYPLSLANSPGILAWPQTHLDWVRPGMMLYGCSPIKGRSEAELGLRPAMTLESRVIASKTVAAEASIGYGGTWRCERPTRIGVLAIGYGDGYPRHAPSGTPVWVKGRQSRLLGRVSMDLSTIDLTSRDDVQTGDWVELWGANVAASTVADRVGTIPYELVTRVAHRVARVYEP